MAGWRVDVLAPTSYADAVGTPDSAAWELGRALGQRGDRCRVLYPGAGASTDSAIPNVESVWFPEVGRDRGPLSRPLTLGRNASSVVAPDAEAVIAFGLAAGALELPRTRRPELVYFAEEVALEAFQRRASAPGGVGRRFGAWFDRRSLKRLEGKAVDTASAIIVPSEREAGEMRRNYPASATKLTAIPPAAPEINPAGGERSDARAALQIPGDVPVTAYVDPEGSSLGRAALLTAFQRLRHLFAGARLITVGDARSTEPGVVAIGRRDPLAAVRAYRAADVVVVPFLGRSARWVVASAMRYGAAVVAVRDPSAEPAPDDAIRLTAEPTPEALSSELAELLADPALRQRLSANGRTFAESRGFSAVAASLEGLVRPSVRA